MKGSLLLAALCLAPTRAHDAITTPITWSREISRIVYSRCAACHQPGGKAFPLLTYAEARPWAVAIKDEVEQRSMPPWGAIKGFGDFRNDQALTPEQIELIVSWASGGAPEGDAKDLPPRPKPARAAPLPPNPPAGMSVSGDTRLRTPMVLDGVWPRTVSRNASLQLTVEMPDGAIEPLLWLYQYRPEFAHPFLLRQPLRLPRGAVIHGVPDGSTVLLLEAATRGAPREGRSARY